MLKFFNTLTRQKEIFEPIRYKKINLFVCGPTVYDFSHLGHARTYVVFDVIAKYLRKIGYNVFYLQNITDIDDKIINRAKESGILLKKLARGFEKKYKEDMLALKVNGVSKYARATDYVKEIISQTERLLKNGFAYLIEDGIYFDIAKFPDYGKLSKRTVLQAEDAVSRIDETPGKRNKGDFCLWKKSKDGEPSWPSPWFSGRPGWHIEDTAITEKHFGPQYDIHGGARDLIIPHHEAEIAQMEAVSGKKPLVKYWIHTEFLTVKKEKMSKSLKNFTTIRNFLETNSGKVLRFFILKSHYRSPIDFNEENLAEAKRELGKIEEFVEKIKDQSPKPKTTTKKLKLNEIKKSFEEAMEDDFNTPRAIAAIFDLISEGNSLMARNELTRVDAKSILEFLKAADKFLDFIFWKTPKEKIPEEVLRIAQERERYRKQQNWQKSDELREEIQKLGWRVEDTEQGPKIKRIPNS